LNNISIQLNIEKAKYNLAGVQSLLKSVSIIYNSQILFF
jgi:hypothetical protein